MSYLVTARKYRPQSFASIVGQEHITVALANAIFRGRVPHALLFTGPRGVGKTTSARVFAKALNCNGRVLPEHDADSQDLREKIEPCGQWTNCQEIAKSASIAVWEIDGASNNSVDNVRDLIESLRTLPPPGSAYKIYIIDEVHMLSTAAFNALLKSLEEPPPQTIFIFATTEPQKIPATVISRCQRHDFRRVPNELIVKTLQGVAEKEGVTVAEDALWFIARRSFGGMRDAQSMFDRLLTFSATTVDLQTAETVFGVVGRGFFFELSQVVFRHDISRALLLLDQVFQGSVDLRNFLSDFVGHWRNLYLVSIASSLEANASDSSERLVELCDFSPEELARAEEQISGLSSFDMERYLDLAEKAVTAALGSSFPRYLLEACLARMTAQVAVRPLAEVISRLEKFLIEGNGVRTRDGHQSVASANELSRVAESSSKKSTERSGAGARDLGSMSFQVGTSSNLSADSQRPIVQLKSEAPVAIIPSPVSSAVELQDESTEPSLPWEAFVSFVAEGGDLLLSSYLRRVSPLVFSGDSLKISGSEFDISSLQEPAILDKLKACLERFSGIGKWTVSFIVGSPVVHASDSPVPAKESTKRKRKQADSYVSGSLAQKDAASEAEKRQRLEEESRSDPAVKAALNAFQGSEIQGVNFDKKES